MHYFFAQQNDTIQTNYQAKKLNELILEVKAKDVSILNHSQRVAAFASCIAKNIGLKSKDTEQIYFAGLLHDIGKIGVPNSILQKPGKLSRAEFAVIKLHPEIGYRITSTFGKTFETIALAIRHHHERWDGNGYPKNLKGREIPLKASILAAADAFDAMISDRIYRPTLGEDNALKEIKKGASRQFDPSIVNVFLDNVKEIKNYFHEVTPKAISPQERRRHFRHYLLNPITARTEFRSKDETGAAQPQGAKVSIMDLSVGGMKIAAPKELPAKKDAVVNISFAVDDERFTFDSQIVWKNEHHEYGLQFLNSPEQKLQSLFSKACGENIFSRHK